MKVLETKRLILRPWREEDAADLYEYARDPAVGPSAGWAPHQCREISLQIIRKFIEEDEVWAVELKDGGKVIGSVGLHHDNMRAYDNVRSLGYVLSQKFWGMGYMTEAVARVLDFAFDELALDLLSVYHFSFNDRSKRVIKKAGFRPEGVLRMAINLVDGAPADRCCYSMTAEEFRQRKYINGDV